MATKIAEGTRPKLLVVLPGQVGRRPLLTRLQATCDLVALVTHENLARCAWARTFLGDANWIECDKTDDFQSAWTAVESWLAEKSAATPRELHGVLCYDEFGIDLSAQLVERLKLPGTPVAQLRALRDKFSFRERCKAAGVPIVAHAMLRSEEDVEALLDTGTWRFPCVLKPVKGAGSYHISRVDTDAELRAIFARLAEQLRQGNLPPDSRDSGFVLEEYFQGAEVDVDGWARHGEVEFCSVSDNRPALEPHFLELGGIYPSQLPRPTVEELERLTRSVIGAFPGFHGAFHFEAKVNVESGAVMPIELNARVGGAECPTSVEAVTGYYLPEVAAKLAVDLPVPLVGKHRHAIVASTNVHHLERGIIRECSKEEIDVEACKIVSCELFGKVGQPHVPSTGSSSCLGWVATGGETADEAEANLQRAVQQLRLLVVPEEGATDEPVAKRSRWVGGTPIGPLG